MFSEFDRLAMTRALALAERGLETTHPNPRVGCVIAKDERIIAEGWHERAGEAHAEVAAIRAAKEPIAGATAYVTLEPCSHYGRTPPCVNALIEARIARVVFAVQDPNPNVSGQGADALLRAGIAVEAGLMEAEATELNIGFMKRMKHGLPWVRVKLAMSLDGRTALANGASQWITGEQARNDVQRWRARCSAVMTGVGTVLADDPHLNVRTVGFKGRQPLRVVLDSRLRSPPGARMFVGLGAPTGPSGAVASGASDGGPAPGPAAASVTGGPASGARAAADRATAAVGGAAGANAGMAASVGMGLGARGTGVANPAGAAGSAAATASAGATAAGDPAADTGRGGPAVAGRAIGAAGANAGASVVGGARIGTASGGEVLIFAAASGGVPIANPAPSAAPTDSTDLAEDMAALVNAFETSPTAVAARSADVAGPDSAKTSGGPAAVTTAGARSQDQNLKRVLLGPTPDAPPAIGLGGVAAPGVGAPGTPAKGTVGAAVASSPDDATWAGAALSGGIAVDPGQPKAPAVAVGAPLSVPGAADGVVRDPTRQGHSGVTGSAAMPKLTSAPAAVPPPSTVAPATPTAVSAASAAGPATPTAASAQFAAAAATPTVAFQARRAALAERGVRIEEVPADDGFLDLFAVLQKLAELEVNEVLVEAGPTLAGQLLTTFFVDELLLYIAPKLLGPQGRPLVNLPELQSLQDAWGFALFDVKRFGDDLRLRLRPK